MAIPTQPSLNGICTEGIKKAGYPSPSSAQVSRANDWVEEVKNDLWTLERKWKPLMVTAYGVTTKGKSRYAMPTDFERELSVSILNGTHTGALQDAAAGSATLKSSESMTTDYALGKLLIITSGTGLGSCSQITAWNNSTKVATVTPNFTTTPVADDNYMVIDTRYPLNEAPIWDRDKEYYPHEMDIPSYFCPMGQGNSDADETGEFELFPVPNNTYGIELRYYANLMLLDLTGEAMKGLYRRWRGVLTQGVFVRQLLNDRDSRADGQYIIYKKMLDELKFKDVYGNELAEMQVRVTD